ncbi:MAG: ribonuclease HII [Flavobacteriaceae bacterium]|nr:ribonuclease HII [Flavobacteriaceae bacterium]
MSLLRCYSDENEFEAGIDEAGRGCLAGPVTAAAVILPPNYDLGTLDDSKKLSREQRFELRPLIEKEALAYSVVHISHRVIDEINILQATFKAMHQCVDELSIRPDLLLIDGNRFPAYLGIIHQCIVKGDAKYQSIAAASILAKTYRDEYMEKLHRRHPQYDWISNKGYPTNKHRSAIKEFGPTKYHRTSFKLIKEQ